MFLDEHINRNFDKLNDNDLHIAHFINTHIDECKNMKIQDLAQFTHASKCLECNHSQIYTQIRF